MSTEDTSHTKPINEPQAQVPAAPSEALAAPSKAPVAEGSQREEEAMFVSWPFMWVALVVLLVPSVAITLGAMPADWSIGLKVAWGVFLGASIWFVLFIRSMMR